MPGPSSPEKGVREVLNLLEVSYEWLDIDPSFADTAAFCEKYGYPPENSGNTIIVASRKEPIRYAACLVQASAHLDVNRTVRKLMGVRRLSFASAEQTSALTGMMIGGVTPFNLPDALPLYVDEPVMVLEYVILGAGSRSAKVKISPTVLEKVPNVQVIPGLSRTPEL